VPGFRDTGETCSTGAECLSGWCYQHQADAPGYCAASGCQNHGECINYGDDGVEMCCVGRAGAQASCLKIAAGASCGSQQGQCGAGCAGQLDSACAPTMTCLYNQPDDPDAICTYACLAFTRCTDCADPQHPEFIFTCTQSGDAVYCLPIR
jgi:hypothetical protein